MNLPWKRLIRFQSIDGRILRGEPLVAADVDIGFITAADKVQARVLSGDDIYDTTGRTRLTDEVVDVETVLAPLDKKEVPILRREFPSKDRRALGLHLLTGSVREAGRKPPPFPFIFFKPNTAVQDHGAPVLIPKIAQDDQADYEGELCMVIGKDAKDVPVSEALSYVAAYTAGNDISSRKLQRDPAFAGVVPQWGFSKGFDTYAPLGPCLVAASEIPDPKELHLRTTVNSELRQDESVSDLLFDCAYLVSYLSQGTTLQKGSVIMTGTPGGVGAGLKPPKYLVPGTQMDVWISGIGTLRNGVVFA